MNSATALLAQTIVAGALGAAIGSFLNVVVLRTHAKRPWVTGHSACPHCGRQLSWWELIPVGSFLALGGRCRTCRKKLSAQYLLLECLTATLFMVVFLRFGWTWQTLLGLVIGSAMLLIAVYDARWALIPDEFSWLFIGASFVWALLNRSAWVEAGIGAVAGLAFFGLQHLLSRGTWVGSGDIFLGVGLGLLLGWRQLLTALVLAYLAGAIVAAIRILRHKTKISAAMPFGPYLMAGGFTAWLFGPAVVMWYLLYVARF